nr:site-specific integrase [Salana multivorans]
MRRLRRELDRAGDLATTSPTLEAWFAHWLPQVSGRRVRPTTQREREGDVRRYILPAIGKVRLDRLTPAHIRQAHALASADGRSTTTALRVHRLLSVALRDAVREGRVGRNVASGEHMDAPRAAITTATTLDTTGALALLRVAIEETHGARWAFGLLTGARVGEVLGLEWDRVDWSQDIVTLSWQLQRIIWEHACGGSCGYERPSYCPQRVARLADGEERREITAARSLHLVRPKTRAGWRVIPLVDPVRGLLWSLWQQQGQPTTGFVFATDGGAPIQPEADYKTWRQIIERAGIAGMRRHDARHTAATLLLGLGIDQEVVRQLLGHSTVAVTARYQHADVRLLREALERLGGAIGLSGLPSAPSA